MNDFVVATVGEIPPGKRKIVEVNGRSVGIFNIAGTYYALRNRCPHQGAPVCAGAITGTALPSHPGEHHYGRNGEILRCPWHGWEFDITSGRSWFDPQRVRVKRYHVTVEHLERYDVTVEDAKVVVHLSSGADKADR